MTSSDQGVGAQSICSGLMRQHIDSFDHFVSVEMKQIVQARLHFPFMKFLFLSFFLENQEFFFFSYFF